MAQLNERGANTERNSALWGTGGRGGDRSSVLWGKGGRGLLVATMVVALAGPLAANASPGHGGGNNGNGDHGNGNGRTAVPTLPAGPATPSGGEANTSDGHPWVADSLLTKAHTHTTENTP